MADIQEHLQQEYNLLKQYEEQLRTEDDPRRLERAKREVTRQREAITDYQREMDELTAVALPTPAAQAAAQQAQASLDALHAKVDRLSQQLTGAESRLAAGQTAIRDDLAAQRQAIIDRVDLRYAQTMQRVADQLDGQQVEIVGMLLAAVDENRIARAEAQQLTRLAANALQSLQESQPDAAEWQDLRRLLAQNTGWAQKVKLTVPLVPYLLTYESEIKIDTAGALKQAWRQLTAALS